MDGRECRATEINAVLMHYIKSLAQTRFLIVYNTQGDVSGLKRHLLSLPDYGFIWRLNIVI